MNQLEAMRIFTRVAELASFTRAADSLGLARASVSGAVSALEAHLDTRLLHRTTRRVQLTQDGNLYYQRALDLLADLDELDQLFHRAPASLSGTLRIDMPSGLAKNLVLPRLPEFTAAHPAIRFELSSTDRKVDPVAEGFDCVIRVGRLADSSLVARPLGQMRLVNCASPAYLAQYGVPRQLADLAGHRLVHYSLQLGSKPDGFEYLLNGELSSLAMDGLVTVNNADAYTAACLAGFGIAQIPWAGVRSYLATGELQALLPELSAEPMPVSVIYPHRRHLSRRVRVFMDWLAAISADYLGPDRDNGNPAAE